MKEINHNKQVNKLKDEKIIKLKKTEKKKQPSIIKSCGSADMDIQPGDSFDLGSFCFTDEESKPKVTFKKGPESEEELVPSFKMQMRAINFRQIVGKQSLLSCN